MMFNITLTEGAVSLTESVALGNKWPNQMGFRANYTYRSSDVSLLSMGSLIVTQDIEF